MHDVGGVCRLWGGEGRCVWWGVFFCMGGEKSSDEM
jgi:hypothetical protein